MISRCTPNIRISALYDAATKPISFRMSCTLELASTFAVVNFVCGFVKADRAAQQDGFVSGAELCNHTPAEVQGILNEASRHMYDFERREPRRWKRYIGPPLPKAKPATKATARKAVA